jgi:hypothetical protein
MFGEMPVDVPADGIFALISMHCDTGLTGRKGDGAEQEGKQQEDTRTRARERVGTHGISFRDCELDEIYTPDRQISSAQYKSRTWHGLSRLDQKAPFISPPVVL